MTPLPIPLEQTISHHPAQSRVYVRDDPSAHEDVLDHDEGRGERDRSEKGLVDGIRDGIGKRPAIQLPTRSDGEKLRGCWRRCKSVLI